MTYVLPDLDYDYGALTPYIAPEVMKLYHSKHHATYVARANTALEQLAGARESGNFDDIGKSEKGPVFHLGGHASYSTFWKDMSPEGGGRPDGELATAIDEYFGGFDGFQKQFNAAASSIRGSGWSMLVFDTFGRRPNINQLYDQQGNLPTGQIPLLQLGMWEHAFYLQYRNVEGGYVNVWQNVVSWPDVAECFIKAQSFASWPPPKLIE